MTSIAKRIDALVLAPLFLAVVLRAVGELFPSDEVWGHMFHSVCLSAWPWLCLFSPLWAMWARVRTKRWTWSMFIGIAVLPLAGFPFLPDSGQGQPILVANVNAFIAERHPLAEAMAAVEADVVIEIEARARQIPGMVRVADNFGEQVSRPSHYTAIYCKTGVQCEGGITEEFGANNMVMPLALVRLDPGVCLMGPHGPPPVPFNIEGLMPYMKRIASSIDDGRLTMDWGPCHHGDSVIIVGDMNAVPGSWATRPFNGKGLRDKMAGHGVFATTWPSGGDWINLPLMQLDHLWVGDVEVGDQRTLRLPKSDHQGIFFRIRADN